MTDQLSFVPPDWMDDAACVGAAAIFDDESRVGVARMKQLCARCPVITKCARFAVATDARYGVWAGQKLEWSRARDVRLGGLAELANVPVPPNGAYGPDAKRVEHGTPGGYQSHHRRGEPACDACRIARNTEAAARARRLRNASGRSP